MTDEPVILIDTLAAASLLDIKPATIRWMAHTGVLTRAGRKGRRTMYNLDHVQQLADARRLDTSPTLANTSMTRQTYALDPEPPHS